MSATQTRKSLVKGERFIRSVWMAEILGWSSRDPPDLTNLKDLTQKASQLFVLQKFYNLEKSSKQDVFLANIFRPSRKKPSWLDLKIREACKGSVLRVKRWLSIGVLWILGGENLDSRQAGYRFSAFWLRSKCSICSYQLNIWYGRHVLPSILNWFLQGDRVQELAPALSWVGLVLQYHQDWPTEPHSMPGNSLKSWGIPALDCCNPHLCSVHTTLVTWSTDMHACCLHCHSKLCIRG